MSRLAVFAVFLLLTLQGQGQMFSHGVPAGATSPEPDGRQHGIPSNVQSPTPIPAGVHPIRTFVFNGPFRRFGNPREHRKIFVPVPVFYPIYGYGDVGYPADPYVQAPSDQAQTEPATPQQQAGSSDEDMLRQAYLEGARDALKDERDRARYGEHYLDSREQQRSRARESTAERDRSSEEATVAPAKKDDGPATVFIFKDGHQIETRNFAIMGQMLYDFSGSILKKVQLADLDKDATLKANDDRGTNVKLP
jgi:hypothetical protein